MKRHCSFINKEHLSDLFYILNYSSKYFAILCVYSKKSKCEEDISLDVNLSCDLAGLSCSNHSWKVPRSLGGEEIV